MEESDFLVFHIRRISLVVASGKYLFLPMKSRVHLIFPFKPKAVSELMTIWVCLNRGYSGTPFQLMVADG